MAYVISLSNELWIASAVSTGSRIFCTVGWPSAAIARCIPPTSRPSENFHPGSSASVTLPSAHEPSDSLSHTSFQKRQVT